MADLILKQVKKSFGAITVIHSVNLEISSGEFVVFVGPSGCGKSTLLRMIAGLEMVTSGQLFIDGQEVTNTEAAERGIAMVFQTYALYPHMTVRENMGFGLKMTGTSKAEIETRTLKAAKILELEALLDRKPKQLSGGQRQRVAIGRAIVREPKVFLFDEPLSNLDAELRVAMRVEIAKLHNDLGNTMIYVTHDQVEAMTLADKIVVLRKGHIEQVGAPLELYDNPNNLFVAGFIGSPSMNFLQAEVVASDANQVTVRLLGQPEQAFTMALSSQPPLGKQYKLGIRPEHFDPNAIVALRLTVDVAEHLGGTSYVYDRNAADEKLILEARDNRQISPHSQLVTAFDPQKSFLFKDSGERVR